MSWVAVQGKDPQEVLNYFGFNRTGRKERIPEAPVSSVSLPNGWFVLFANKFNAPIVSERALQVISSGCQAVSCQVEEHVMFSSVTCYNNGVLAWHVEHDAQQNIYHIASKGSVPEQFKTILAASKKEQDEAGGEKADTDYIHDAPILLAQAVTSFRHDQDIPNASPEPFEVLASANAASSSAKPWWKLW
jgi:hypothetical protein